MSSFVAAGTAYSVHGINTIPFYTYYSMFGFQRVGDLIWLAGDARCRGFLMVAAPTCWARLPTSLLFSIMRSGSTKSRLPRFVWHAAR